MGWLAKIGIQAILDWALGKILALFSMFQKAKIDHQTQVDQAAQDMKKAKELKPDSTEKEVDDAIDDSLKHF